ncbi:MAG: DUF3365 domain-containing protein [Deltaproteobacteria bacterium]|nr:DUF3365 domain-containing protein [Deltaproteobacteria bacterium]
MSRKAAKWIFTTSFAWLMLGSIALSQPGAHLPKEEALEKGREITTDFSNEFISTLTMSLGSGDYLKAIEGCAGSSQNLLRAFNDRTGYYIRRVSLRYRNLANNPDSYEKERLMAFDRLGKEGKITDGYEDYKITFEEGTRYMRYLKPLIIKEMCLKCHGSKDDVPEGIQQFLRQAYPHDKAVDYKVGEVRGAVSVKIPLTFE